MLLNSSTMMLILQNSTSPIPLKRTLNIWSRITKFCDQIYLSKYHYLMHVPNNTSLTMALYSHPYPYIPSFHALVLSFSFLSFLT